MPKPTITICIIHFGREKVFKNCVRALVKNTKIKFRLRILFNGEPNKLIPEFLRKIKRNNLELITSKKNLGCGGGRNILSKKIDTKFTCFLDDDIIVCKNWLEPVIEILEKNPNIARCGFTLKENGIKKLGGARLIFFPNILRPLFRIEKFNKEIVFLVWPTLVPKNKIVYVDNVIAGGSVFRLEALRDIYFDPFYFCGFDDVSLGFQLISKGWDQAVFTKDTLTHICRSKFESKKYIKLRFDKESRKKSLEYFEKMWGIKWIEKNKIICALGILYCLITGFNTKNRTKVEYIKNHNPYVVQKKTMAQSL